MIDPAVDYPSPLYLSSTGSTITNSWRLVGTSPTPQDNLTDTIPAQSATGYYQFRPRPSSTTTAGTPSATPTGRGWALDTRRRHGLPGRLVGLHDPGRHPEHALHGRLGPPRWSASGRATIPGGTFTSTGVLLDPSTAGAKGSSELRPGSTNTVTVTDSFSLPQFTLAANERLYVELWRRQIGGINAVTATRRQLDLLVNNGTARIVHPAADDAGPTGSLTSPGAVIRGTATAHRERRGHGLGRQPACSSRARPRAPGRGRRSARGHELAMVVGFDTTPCRRRALRRARHGHRRRGKHSTATVSTIRVDN